jgi:hypothetical protein
MRRYLIGQDDDGRWSLSFERATVGAFSSEDDTAAAAIVLARKAVATGTPAEVVIMSGTGEGRVVWNSGATVSVSAD